jgi:hypothetical protein
MRHGMRVSGALPFVTLSIIATATVVLAAVTIITAPPTLAVTQTLASSENSSLVVRQISANNPDLSDLAPGDRTEWAAEVTNTGEPGTLSVQLAADGDSTLMTGEADGMRMFVDLCTSRLVPTVSALGVTTFTCASGETRIGSSTSADERHVFASSPIETGETVGVRVLILFPASAGNSAENGSAALDVGFGLSSESEAGTVSATSSDTQYARTALPAWLALPGISPIFVSIMAASLFALGILLVAYAFRRRTYEEEETP